MMFEMTETQVRDAIVKMNNSEEYLALRKYYSEDSFIKILRVSRDEKVHSNFIAWLLNPASHHELDYFPLQKFLQMLAIVHANNENNTGSYFPAEGTDKFLLTDYELSDECEVKAEVSTGAVAGFDKKGRVDILLLLRFKDSDKTLPVVIENKVLSTENKENDNKMQTQKYYDWGTIQYGDNTKYERPIYVFLAPDFERDIKCSSPHFIKLSYQNMVDYLIEPCLLNTSNNQARFLIENYLRCLSNATLNQTEDGKEGKIMAFVGKEKELLKKFYEKNKDLFEAVLKMLSANDEEFTDEERKRFSAALAASHSRDNSKYSFDGKGEYPKGQVLLELVKKYIDANSTADTVKLKEVFDLKLVFNKKPIILMHDETTQKMRDGAKVEPVTLADGTSIYINKQVQIGDMDEIIRIANGLGYTIKKL